MLDFNLEYLKAFYYAAQLKSTTKAAKALFLTQPAISHSIKLLEKHMGCALFNRTPKGMGLTREGELLLTHVSEAFDALVTGQRELSLLANNINETLKIGVTETALHYYLLKKIEELHNNHPKSYVYVTGSSTPENLQLLYEDKVDLVVAVSPVENSENLDILELFEFRDIFIAGSKYSELIGKSIAPKEIYGYPMVSVESGTSARNHINSWFNSHGLFFSPKYSVRTSTAILPFVECNLAIGIVPSMFAEALIKQGKIFEVKLEPEIAPRKIILVSKRHSQMSPLCQTFMGYFKPRTEIVVQ